MVPSEFTGALREAYVAGYKVCPQTLRIQPAAKALNSLQSGYAAGVQVTVSVNLNSGKNLKPVEYSGGIQQVCTVCSDQHLLAAVYNQRAWPNFVVTAAAVVQDSLLRSLLKGVVWRVFSTALTVGIILAVFRDTVQVSQALTEFFLVVTSFLWPPAHAVHIAEALHLNLPEVLNPMVPTSTMSVPSNGFLRMWSHGPVCLTQCC